MLDPSIESDKGSIRTSIIPVVNKTLLFPSSLITFTPRSDITQQ